MRRFLVDNARAKRSDKRGGGRQSEPLADLPAPSPDDELLALHEALVKLAVEDPVKAQLRGASPLCGVDGRPGGGSTGHLSQYRGSPLGVCAGLAAN